MPTKTRQTPRTGAPLTVRQVIEELGGNVSENHIRLLISRGDIPVIRVPGMKSRSARVLVSRDDWEKTIAKWREAS